VEKGLWIGKGRIAVLAGGGYEWVAGIFEEEDGAGRSSEGRGREGDLRMEKLDSCCLLYLPKKNDRYRIFKSHPRKSQAIFQR